MSTTRREFLVASSSLALAGVPLQTATAAIGPNDKFDLVIKGGDVLDPSQNLRGKRDIGTGTNSRSRRAVRPAL